MAWNAHAAARPHLGTGPLHRSTLSDADQRRPLAVFTETFARLAGQLDRSLRRDGRALLRLIDATPIPLERRRRGRGGVRHPARDRHAPGCPRVPILRLVDLLRQGLFEPQTWAEVRALLSPRPTSTTRRTRRAHAS